MLTYRNIGQTFWLSAFD